MNDLVFNFLDWDSDFYRFSRSTKDMHPYELIRDKDKTTIVFNALGLPKDKISVQVDKSRGTDYLIISGEAKNEITEKTYLINARFIIDAADVKDIKWNVKDGLLYIHITYKQEEKSKIDISYQE